MDSLRVPNRGPLNNDCPVETLTRVVLVEGCEGEVGGGDFTTPLRSDCSSLNQAVCPHYLS